MPICSECLKEKERSAYTKKQLSKPSALRRCYRCVEAKETKNEKKTGVDEGSEYGIETEERPKLRARRRNPSLAKPPGDAPPLSPEDDPRGIARLVVDAAAKALERGIPPNVGLDNFGQAELIARLWEVVNNRYMTWLTVPFLRGLIWGGRAVDQRVAMDPTRSEALPLLHWLCQYKLCRQHAYCGADDMVALALAAGADVNLIGSNKTNALFFAVKYSSARCVDMLLDAGADVTQRDVYGHTMWKNAVERPDIEIIEALIRRCNGIIPISQQRITAVTIGTGLRSECSIADHMLSLYTGMSTPSDVPTNAIPVSWVILGDPTIEELAVALVRVMQGGSTFSPFSLPPNASPLSIATHIRSPRIDTKNYDQFQYDTICYLRDVIFGRHLPRQIQREIAAADQIVSLTNETCPICLTDMDGNDANVTLYCGHRYCVECIKVFGETNDPVRSWIEGTNLILDDSQRKEKRCPICRRLMCGDIANTPCSIEGMPDSYRVNFPSNRKRMGVLGVDRHDAIMTYDGTCGPQVLSDDQLRFECNAVLKKSQGTRDQLLEDLLNLSACANTMGVNEYIASDGRTIPIDGRKCMVELSSTYTLVGTHILLVHPQTGPVVVPIEIKRVSILAYLSPNSLVTVVPISVVNTFGLRTKPMASDKFICPYGHGRHISVSAVVDELKFHLGGIEICLNNAVVVRNEVEGMMDGIRLGMDFFASAAWVRCSTRLQDSTFVITSGGTDNLFLPDQADELRYYSRDGKTCQLPFVHIANLAASEMLFLVSIDEDISKTGFEECQWCCRCFPSDGMTTCERGGKSHYYCDEECKSQGDEICALLGE